MTDTLDRINTVLGGWEAQPDTTDVDGWLPGVPLHERPRGWDAPAFAEISIRMAVEAESFSEQIRRVHAQALRHPSTNKVELRIEAGINDRRYGARIVLDEAELALDPGLYGRTLDEMVEHIEAQARRRQQASPSAPPPSANPRSRR